jgi:hypothetical protein
MINPSTLSTSAPAVRLRVDPSISAISGLLESDRCKESGAAVSLLYVSGSRPKTRAAALRAKVQKRLGWHPPHVRDIDKRKRSGLENSSIPPAPCKRQCHDGQIRSSRDTSETSSTAQRCGAIGPKWTHAVDGNGCNWLNINGWALNSAVECHPHTSPLSNTFNNLTRLPGTAKYLIIRGSQNQTRCCNGGLPTTRDLQAAIWQPGGRVRRALVSAIYLRHEPRQNMALA